MQRFSVKQFIFDGSVVEHTKYALVLYGAPKLAKMPFAKAVASCLARLHQRKSQAEPYAIVVNTARGEVIDEPALANMLARGEIAGAGLDVYENEPAINPKLLKLPNVVLLPHMGSATVESRIDMGEKVIINIKTFMDGHRPPDRVIPAML